MIGIPMGVLCFVKQVINMVQFWKASKIVSVFLHTVTTPGGVAF